jgi:hypothetical protein
MVYSAVRSPDWKYDLLFTHKILICQEEGGREFALAKGGPMLKSQWGDFSGEDKGRRNAGYEKTAAL